jgi:hypothetical protein
MDLTLDYNVELFPLKPDQSFALALASSLARGGATTTGTVDPDAMVEDTDDKDRDVWRPDGKGRRGLEEDYDYVMYGKASMNRWLSGRRLQNSDVLIVRCTNLIRALRRLCAYL